jgi:hypothetical protein
VAQCATCHVEHHEPDRACRTCHATSQIVEAHQPPVVAHEDCDACHAPARVDQLLPTRQFCLTCHEQEDHYAPKQCTACHFQATPEGYRPHLTQKASG